MSTPAQYNHCEMTDALYFVLFLHSHLTLWGWLMMLHCPAHLWQHKCRHHHPLRLRRWSAASPHPYHWNNKTRYIMTLTFALFTLEHQFSCWNTVKSKTASRRHTYCTLSWNESKEKVHQYSVFLPVGDAEVSVVGEVALVGSLPGDSSPRSTADLTPEGDALSVVTCHITQRYKELRRNWWSKKSEVKCWDLLKFIKNHLNQSYSTF